MKAKTKKRVLGEFLFFVFAFVSSVFFMVWHDTYVDTDGGTAEDLSMLILALATIYVVRGLYAYIRVSLKNEE